MKLKFEYFKKKHLKEMEMKIKKIAIVMALSLCWSLNVMAGKASEGGEKNCMELYSLASKAINDLFVVGQEKVSERLPMVNLSELFEARKKLRCIPVLELDRTARTEKSTGVLELLVNEESQIPSWNELDDKLKLQLVLHEVNIIAGLETDGDYFFSDELVKLLISNFKKEYLVLEMTAAKKIFNSSSNTVTLISPSYDGEEIDKDAAYCEFYGLGSPSIRGSYERANRLPAINLLPDGGVGLVDTYYVISHISCKLN
jgi:hypothetical protein